MNSEARNPLATDVIVQVERMQIQQASGPCKAFACLSFSIPAGRITIDNWRLLDLGEKGRFVAPMQHQKNDKWYNDVGVTGPLRDEINRVAWEHYRRVSASVRVNTNPEITDADVPF